MLTPDPSKYNVPWTTNSFHGMPYRLIGRSGLRASAVGLGTWKIGHPETGDGARVGEAAAFALFDRAVELGVTFWDTANRYNGASGNSERVIGSWLQRNPQERRNIILATKVFGGMDGETPNHSRLSRQNILDSVQACLERLRVDHIDLLYFHSYETDTPPEESLAAIEDLVSRDLIRYFGVSNFTVDELALYHAVEEATSIRCRVVALQNQYDMLNGEQASYTGVLHYTRRTGISFIPYSPLARGLLSDRYLDPEKVGPGNRLYDEGSLHQDAHGPVLDILRRLAKQARKWDLELSQLALAYTLAQPGMGPVIPSASNLQQLESNAAAGKVTLSADQLRRVEELCTPR